MALLGIVGVEFVSVRAQVCLLIGLAGDRSGGRGQAFRCEQQRQGDRPNETSRTRDRDRDRDHRVKMSSAAVTSTSQALLGGKESVYGG